MSTISIDGSEGQCFSTLYLYHGQLYYLACGSNHVYGGDLSFKLLHLYSKLFKGCTLRLKTSLKW
jgi:hypothetical protein